MKRFVGTIKRTSTQLHKSNGTSHYQDPLEEAIIKEVTAFCNSGTGTGRDNSDEYLHLPAIVEAAESSPAATKAAANLLHKYLAKPNSSKDRRQYHAIMLIRILADNPGPTFTRNIDKPFVSSLKILLRDGKDTNMQQILRETLEFLSTSKADDPNLAELNSMWKKEKDKFMRQFGTHPLQQPGQHPGGGQQDFFSSHQRTKDLPAPAELAARISEASMSAKLLLQMVQSTSASEFFQNDMLKEFASRCQRASRSLQAYMEATNPAPDEQTMITLIETNDKISVSLSKYQRAYLNARKHLESTRPTPQPIDNAAQSRVAEDRPISPLGLTEPTVVPPSKPSVPILSIPRKALQKLKRDHASNATPKASSAMAPASDTSKPSPIDSKLPQPFQTANTNPTNVPTSHAFQNNPVPQPVEDPFADKFSTLVDEKPLNSYSDNNGYHQKSNDHGFGYSSAFGQEHPAMQTTGSLSTTQPTTTSTMGPTPHMHSTYQPGGHDALFDSDFTLPPTHPKPTTEGAPRA